MHFESEEDRKNIDNIIPGFEAFCVGAVNVCSERYRFNKRTQDVGERLDVYLLELRRLAKSCNFAAMEESMLRDRIVVGIRDDVTRRKLLQMRDLTLNQAIDMCKASETAGQQLKEMATSEEVQLLKSEKQPHRRRGRGGRATVELEQLRRRTRSTSTNRRDRSAERSCRYCGRHHDVSKQSCPAFGQTCAKCHKRNHFAAVCRSRPATTTPSHQQNVREIDEAVLQTDTALTIKRVGLVRDTRSQTEKLRMQ